MNVNIPIDEVYNKIMNFEFFDPEDERLITLLEILETKKLSKDEKKDKINFSVFINYLFVLSAEGKTENEIEKWIASTSDTIYKMYQKEHKRK